jgi:hypothetical protein
VKTLLKLSFIVLLCSFVNQGLVAQSIQITSQNNIGCSNPNGSVSASVDGATQGYSFEWHAGADLTGPLLSTNAVASGLAGGIYTVNVTENSTGVVTGIASASVMDAIEIPQVSIQVLSHLTSCFSPNGSMKAIVPAPASDYSYEWYQGTEGTGPVLSTSQSLSYAQAGIYSVKVTNNSTLCQAVASAIILDQTIKPAASISILSHATSCNNNNGSLKAIVTGPAANYNFRWYRGADTAGPNISTKQSINGLAAGSYTVSVREKATWCETIVTATVLPDVFLNVVPTGGCNNITNGSLTAVVQGNPTRYDYLWFAGTNFSGPVIGTTQTLSGLPAGTYSVSVRNRITSCQTRLSATVGTVVVIPEVSVQVVSHLTSCLTPNGSLTAVVDGPLSDYTFEWYEGPIVWSGPLVSVNSTVDGLSAGEYSVLVEHINSGCRATSTAMISEEVGLPNIAVIASDLTSCGLPNGSLSAVANGPLSDYTFEWFQGSDVSGPLLAVGPIVQHLFAGIYTVVATHNNSRCKSIVSAMINDARINLVASIYVLSDDTSCTTSNGALIAGVNIPSVNYTYQWYEGFDIFSGALLSVTQTVDQLPAGAYTVLVTDQNSGCLAIASAQVQEACDSVSNAMNTTTAAAEESAISYYPNPTNGTLWVQSEAAAGDVVVMDRMGRVVRKQKSDASRTPFSFDLSDQPPGQYIIKFTSSQGSSQYHIIKE